MVSTPAFEEPKLRLENLKEVSKRHAHHHRGQDSQIAEKCEQDSEAGN